MKRVKDKSLLLLSSIGAVAFLFTNLVSIKPNRIAQGPKIASFEFFGLFAILILTLWIILINQSKSDKKQKDTIVFIVSSVLLITLLVGLSARSPIFIDTDSARLSLASGFYVQLFVIYLLLSTYTKKVENNVIKVTILIMTFGLIIFYAVTGAFSDLSLFKEYEIKQSQFYDNLKIHALLTFMSVLTGVIIAVPLGYLAYSKNKFENTVMMPLSVIQTIPSLSLFGVLLVPLSRLGDLAFFDFIGVSGIGWAPAYIALSLYTLLPIARNTLTGFYSVDKNMIEAAKGMGMSKNQVLRKIQAPLAFPVIFAGIRIAFVQTIGGAVLAGLVGGGGMGTFVFLGLGEASPDLILLGVLPIVFFTILLDFSLKKLEEMIREVIYD